VVGPIDGVVAIHNAFRADMAAIDAPAVAAAILNEVAPLVAEAYPMDHRRLDSAFETLSDAVSAHDGLAELTRRIPELAA
jgi:hypothetical protein